MTATATTLDAATIRTDAERRALDAAEAPHDLRAEISVLGGALQDDEAAKKAADLLRVSDFFRAAHGKIFDVVQSLVHRGIPPDLVTATDELDRRGWLEAVGGGEYLARLVDQVATAANILHHARVVRQKADLRHIMQTCTRAAEKAANGSDPHDLVADLRGQLDAITPAEAGRKFLVKAGDLKAMPVTFTVDTLVPAGMLTLLSGRDKRGKTLLAQEIIRAVLHGTAFLDRFPSRPGPVVGAFLDDPAGLTLDRLNTLGIREHVDLYLVDPLVFDGDATRFLDRLEAEAVKVHPVLVVVDSFYQLVPSGRDSGNDQARMAPLMARLNHLAEQTGAAVLVVAHDNKSGGDVAGSHVIRAAAKSILRLTLPRGAETEDEDGPPTTPRRILTVESKFAGATSWALEIGGVGRWRCYGSPQDLRASDTRGAVRDFLGGGGGGTAEEIAKAINRRRDDVDRVLPALCETGEAASEPRKPGGRGRPATIYRGAESPSEFPSRDEFPSGGRDGNSDAQLFDFPAVAGASEFPSGIPTPRSLSEKSPQARFGHFSGRLKWWIEPRSSILSQL